MSSSTTPNEHAEDQAAQPHGDEQPVVSGSSHERGYFPDRRVWYLVVLSAFALVAAKLAMSDNSAFHIALVVSASVCATALWIWFTFFSAYSLRARSIVSFACLALVAWLPTQYRVQRFSGSLIPTIVKRGAPDLDETLPVIESSASVDLASTTEYDFPQFLGPNRNSVITKVRLERNWATHPPRELWRRDIGAGWSGFVAVNGYALTMEQRGDQELVTCYDLMTGEPQWGSAINAFHNSALGFKGPRGTPTVHQGRVYAIGATGVMRCLNGTDGSTLWRRDFLDDLGISQEAAEGAVAWGRSASPLIIDETVVLPVGGGSSADAVTLAALKLSDGTTVWESTGYQISYASPALMMLDGMRQIVSVNENYVTGHDPNSGEVLWDYPWEGLSNMNANCSQPLQVGNSLVLLSKGYSKGAERIEVTASDGEWEALLDWENKKTLRTKFSNVAVRDGFAYALDDGILTCADLETGERKWRKGRYRYGQILLVHDLLLVLSEFGELALVEATPDGYRELHRIEALEGQTWNNLCLYGPYLLIRNAEQAACYELKLAPTADL